MTKSSLTIVGSGIKFISHLTTESIGYIEQADLVLYLTNEPAIKQWIMKTNPTSESLDSIYFDHDLRINSYNAITNYIIKRLKEEKNICVVLYGHPAVHAKPAIDAVKAALDSGYNAKLLPGISAEACLFADLLIDPATHGCLSYDATELLIHDRIIDNNCHLIIWQASVIGALGHGHKHNNSKGLTLLTNYLQNYYDEHHSVTLYSAAQYPGMSPSIRDIKLYQLKQENISRLTTLYIPPLELTHYNMDILKEINKNHF
jgi:tetrapyrrole methylase family protein/MazG family protein